MLTIVIDLIYVHLQKVQHLKNIIMKHLNHAKENQIHDRAPQPMR